MKNENGKITFTSLVAFALLAYLGYCAFVLISSKVKSDTTQKEIMESILKFRVDESLTSKATAKIISILQNKGFTLDNDDLKSIEVYHDRQKRVIELYYSYSYEMDFLLFQHVSFVEVEDSHSSERWN